MNAFIYPNFSKKDALKCANDSIKILTRIGYNIFTFAEYKKDFSKYNNIKYLKKEYNIKNIDLAVAIGGDGTILRCAKHFLKYPTEIVGINTGRLGFMSSIEYDEIEKLKNINNLENCHISKRIMLNGIINDTIHFDALNDIVLSSTNSKLCDFNIYENDMPLGKYRADGIIISTPTGATAYALSAGGSIIHPELDCFELTMICPHSLFYRPIIFSANSKIEITVNTSSNSKILVSSDGENSFDFKSGDKIVFSKSKYEIFLIDLHGNTFFETLNKKLMHPLK